MEAVLKKHLGSTRSQLEKEEMNISDNFIDPFAGVATTFRQDSVIDKQFSCLEAEEVSIGQTICKKKCGDLFLKVFHYVPLIRSLEQFLSHPWILSMVEMGPQRCKEGFFLMTC